MEKEQITSTAVDELTVKAAPAKRGDWINTVPISGSLRSRSTVDVQPEVGGRLVHMLAVEGDLVQKGKLLAEIDDENYRLAYQQSAAALKVAQAGLLQVEVSAEYAKTEKKRADNLLQSGGITQKDHQAAATNLKQAKSQVGLAEAQCLQAETALAIAEKALKDCKVYAPAGGHVQKRWLDEGSLLSPGVPVYTLVDNSQLELECVIPSYHLASIRPGQKAEFTTPSWGAHIFGAIVSAINPTIQSENRSVKIKLKVENRGMELRSGMYTRGKIFTGVEKNVVVISRDALIPEQDVSEYGNIYIVEDGKARRRRVRIGGNGSDSVWIREGLEEGEMVVLEKGPSLKEGTPVRIVSGDPDSGS
jgi:RND family efflux transporter MFP subunit